MYIIVVRVYKQIWSNQQFDGHKKYILYNNISQDIRPIAEQVLQILDNRDIQFKLKHGKMNLGKTLSFTLTGYNPTNLTHTVTVSMSASVNCERENRAEFIYDKTSSMFAGEDTNATLTIHLLSDNYARRLGVDKTLIIDIKAEVKQTGQKFKHSENISFAQPSIIVSCEDTSVDIGYPVKLKLVILNPRAVPLTNSTITLQSYEHLALPFTINCGTVKPKHKVLAHFAIPTKCPGLGHVFVATFDCTELKGVKGECSVDVGNEVEEDVDESFLFSGYD